MHTHNKLSWSVVYLSFGMLAFSGPACQKKKSDKAPSKNDQSKEMQADPKGNEPLLQKLARSKVRIPRHVPSKPGQGTAPIVITIQKTQILANGEPVVTLKGGKIPGDLMRDGPNGNFVDPLYKKLKPIRRIELRKARAADKRAEMRAIVKARPDVPLRVMEPVLHTLLQSVVTTYTLVELPEKM